MNARRTVLVILEVKYWHDLREGLAAYNVDFLGFDKKTPNRQEIEQLVKKSDFIFIRNRNVAHHSVTFAKTAAKAMNKPFMVSQHFGVDKIMQHLQVAYPEDTFTKMEKNATKGAVSKMPKVKPVQAKLQAPKGKYHPKVSKSLGQNALHEQLKNIQVDDEPDFSKLFKK